MGLGVIGRVCGWISYSCGGVELRRGLRVVGRWWMLAIWWVDVGWLDLGGRGGVG